MSYQEQVDTIVEKASIEGCGLALLSPYFNGLFNACEFLEKGNFINQEAQLRAISLLHYIIYGRENHVSEEQYILPFLLCNASFDYHLTSLPKLTSQERSLADSLLLEVGLRCSRLKYATTQAIRENFIQRNGKLSIDRDNVKIEVRKCIHDVLLGNLPEQTRVSGLPWLNKEVILEWTYSD